MEKKRQNLKEVPPPNGQGFEQKAEVQAAMLLDEIRNLSLDRTNIEDQIRQHERKLGALQDQLEVINQKRLQNDTKRQSLLEIKEEFKKELEKEIKKLVKDEKDDPAPVDNPDSAPSTDSPEA